MEESVSHVIVTWSPCGCWLVLATYTSKGQLKFQLYEFEELQNATSTSTQSEERVIDSCTICTAVGRAEVFPVSIRKEILFVIVFPLIAAALKSAGALLCECLETASLTKREKIECKNEKNYQIQNTFNNDG